MISLLTGTMNGYLKSEREVMRVGQLRPVL